MSTGLALLRLPSKQSQPERGQFEHSVSKTMPVRCEIRWYTSEVDDSADFQRKSRLPPAVSDSVAEPFRSMLTSVLCSAFTSQRHRANISFTAKEMKTLRQVAGVGGAYHSSRKQEKQGSYGGCCWASAESSYQSEWGAEFSAKRAAEVQQHEYATIERFASF